MLSSEQAEEILKCRNDADYFVRTYGWMRHVMFGPIRFIPWDWQTALLNLWQAGKSTITNKSRQIGASWTAIGYVNWLINFHPEINILLLSQKEEKAISLLDKLTFFYRRLPDWLRARSISDSRRHFSVAIRYYDETNGKWLQANGDVSSLTTTGSSGAGESARAVIIDEFALMSERNNDEAVWAAVAPTTTHGGQLIVLSTPRGSFGEFYRIWHLSLTDVVNAEVADDNYHDYRRWNAKVIQGANRLSMVPLAVHYSMCAHGERWIQEACRGLSEERANKVRAYFSGIVYNEAWGDEQAARMKLSKPQRMQELELVFESSGAAVFSTEDLNACYLPIKAHPLVNQLVSGSQYFYIGVDSAEGMTLRNRNPDYNCIQVINQNGVQVYCRYDRDSIDEWAGKTVIDPRSGHAVELKGTVLKIIEQFRPCTVIVEKNAQGLTVQNRIAPYMDGLSDVELICLPMTQPIKAQMISELQSEMASEQAVMYNGRLMTIRQHVFTDYFTVQCMRQFVKIGQSQYGAPSGFYDDPVIAYLWAAYARRTHGVYDGIAILPQGNDLTLGIPIEAERNLKPDDVEDITASYGPAIATQEDLLEGMALDIFPRTKFRQGLVGHARGLGGKTRSLEGVK